MKTLNKKVILSIALFAFSFVSVRGVFAEDIVIDTDTTWATGVYTYDNVYITNGATLTFDGKVTLNAQNLTIDSMSSISADGRGYGSDSGPGAGGDGRYGGGAGYGGSGGSSSWGASGGSTYGLLTEPTDLGSGGGTAYRGRGGAGGGVIRLAVAGTLKVDGSLTANGKKGGWYSDVYGYEGGGGGSGGSIYITASTYTGTGVVSANGGDGGKHWRYPTYYPCGGGGGGRIAIYYDTNMFTGTMSATGGTGHQAGGAGTVFTKCSTATFADLLIDNGGLEGAMTPVVFPESFDEITVVNGGRLGLTIHLVDFTVREVTVANQAGLDLTGCENLACPQMTVANQSEVDLSTLQSLTTDQLSITEGALVHVSKVVTVESLELGSDVRINHPAGEVVGMTVGGDLVIDGGASITASLDLSVPGDLTIGSGSSISADGRGYGSDSGPGAGGDGYNGGGAGYGGHGGRSRWSGCYGGSTYGSLTEPADLGSGGGSGMSGYFGVCGSVKGGAGGGAMRLRVAGTLTVDGSLTTNGRKGGWCSVVYGSTGAGGGSGGSIYVTASTFAGTGVISANGGDGGESWERAGGGGGGRIAIYYDTNTYGGAISAYGGSGCEAGEDGTVLLDRLMNAPDTDISLSEESSSQSTLIETVLSQTASINNVTITGDLSGTLNFTSFETVSIKSGSFAGEGFSKGQFEATLEGVSYTGDWEGVLFLNPEERKIYLKGAVFGEVLATVEGYLTESVPDSNTYNEYQATWKIGRLGGETVSATINLTGVVTYQDSFEYPSTELYALQTSIEGNTFGHYTGPLSTVLTHVRVADETNPYYGEGFSIISYVSDFGSGQGWTYDKLTSPDKVELQGLFSSPLFGIVSGILDEAESPRTLFLNVRRVDLGLPPAPDLKVKIWGPTRVSPGQTINYIIEYRNDGVKAANDVDVVMKLPLTTSYLSNTGAGVYNSESREVVWHFDNIPAKYVGYVSVKETILWGLSQGVIIDHIGLAPMTKPDIQIDPTVTIDYEILEETENLVRIDADISNYLEGGTCHLDVSISEVSEEIQPVLDVSETLEGWQFNWKFTVEGHSTDLIEVVLEVSDVAVEVSEKWSEVEEAKKAEQEHGSFLDWLRDENLICQDTYESYTKWNKFRSKIPIIRWLIGKTPKVGWIESFFPKGTPFGSVYANAVLWGEVRVNLVFKQANGEIPGDVDSLDELYMFYKSGESYSASSARSTVRTARDPSVKYGPEGRVSPGQRLDYTVEYENEGEGIAFGVYFTDTLDEDLNDLTLEIGPVIDVNDGSIISGPGIYNPATRTITWFAGEVGPGEGGYAVFDVNVVSDANHGTEIINYATIYFPSVPEETRTNGIVSIVSLNQPPVAICQDVTVAADDNCQGIVTPEDVNNGSFDPDGDPITLSLSPSGPYPLGTTNVSLIATDDDGESDTCSATVTVVDVTPPEVGVIIPLAGAAVQDGATLTAEASDLCGSVVEVYFYLREPGGTNGVPIGHEDLPATLNTTSGKWEYGFDTTQLQDGYYVILAKAIDTCGNEGWSAVVAFSIRNWAVLELLPASVSNKAGRTMPVKFALRIVESVDPEMPFVYNEGLEIRIYDAAEPTNILQTSLYGDTSRDYRIDSARELYITNFKTKRQPAEYVVEIWRTSKNFLVGSFTFETVK